MTKKKKFKEKEETKEGAFQAEHVAKPSSINDHNEVGENTQKEMQQFETPSTTTTTAKDDSRKVIKKRKHSEKRRLKKVKKRKTSLAQEERDKHCQKLIQTDQKEMKSLKAREQSQDANRKTKSVKEQKNMVTRGEMEHSSSQLGKKAKRKNRQKEDNAESSSHYDVTHTLWNPNKEMAKHLGLKMGKWTKKEERILRENMDRYLKYHKIDDPKKIIFAYQNTESEEGKKWKEFAKSTDFYRELSKGLKRSLYFVYRKALRMFDDSNHVGKFSESEDKELLRLVAVHGRNWAKIGGMMERSGMSVSHRYDLIKDQNSNGPWQENELKSLHEAVRKLTNTRDGEEVYSGINWTAVALIVKSRNNVQCRRKWLRGLCWKSCKLHPTEEVWGPKHDVELIDKIYKSQITEECDIDWLSLTTDFQMARSPEWLKIKFAVIKRKYCKSINLEVKEFDDIIDYLYNEVAIDLQNQIFQHQEQNS